MNATNVKTDTVTLITMPFVDVSCPSIGLTQLKEVATQTLGDRVKVKVLYLNHDFAKFMAEGERVMSNGVEMTLYDYFCGNQLHNTGLGDWFFRQVAFPDAPDNTKEYFTRYFPGRTPEVERFKSTLLERRAALEVFMDSLIERYAIDDSRIVGFTSMFQQNGATFAMARRLKRARPDLTVVVGGANCEAPMGHEMIRNVDCVDYVFSGPALKSFPEFVEKHLANDLEGLRHVKGVLTKNAPKLDAHAAMGEELDINEDIKLDYSDFLESMDEKLNGHTQPPIIFFETSRGCWWGERAHCTFCGLNGLTMEYRAMTADKAVNHIQWLVDRYAGRSNYFFCVDNIMPTNYMKEVLPKIKLPADSMIFYEVKANLTDEDVKGLAAAGVKKIQPGIESMATSTLKLMKKGSSSFVNIKLLKSCVKYNVRPQWNLLIGFPGEGEDVYSMYVRDLHKLTHLYPPDGAFPVRFDRYSPYYTKADEYGLKLKQLDYYGLTYPFEDASLAQMAYFFTDTNFQAPYIQSMLKWLGRVREKAHTWLARWQEKDRISQPKLYLTRGEDGGVIHDSRTESISEHTVNARQVKLLEHLESSRNFDSLHKEFGPELDSDLDYLNRRGLLWTEDDRVMSVVVFEPY